MLADAAGLPLASWQALRDAVTGAGTEAETALSGAATSADTLGLELDDTAAAAGGAEAAASAAGAAAAESAAQAATGWAAVTGALADYAAKARDIGGDIGQTLVGAFQSAENAVATFVKSGKLEVRDLVTSMIADLAQLGARRFILGPDRQCPLRRAGRCGRGVRRCPARGRYGRIARSGPRGASHGLCRCPADAHRRLRGPPSRRGSGDPAARRTGAVASRGRWLWAGAKFCPEYLRHDQRARCRELPAIPHASRRRHCPRRVDGTEGDVSATPQVGNGCGDQSTNHGEY